MCHAEKWVGGDRPERIVQYGPANKSSWRGLLLDQNRISTSATVVRRSCLEQVGMFDESTEFITAEDYEMWMKLARTGCRFEFLTDVLGVYRRHESNASGSILRHLAAERAVASGVSQAGKPLQSALRERGRHSILVHHARVHNLKNIDV